MDLAASDRRDKQRTIIGLLRLEFQHKKIQFNRSRQTERFGHFEFGLRRWHQHPRVSPPSRWPQSQMQAKATLAAERLRKPTHQPLATAVATAPHRSGRGGRCSSFSQCCYQPPTERRVELCPFSINNQALTTSLATADRVKHASSMFSTARGAHQFSQPSSLPSLDSRLRHHEL